MSIRSLFGQTAIYGISSIAGRLLYFLLTPVYTNLYPPADYGVVSHLFVIIGFLMVGSTLRIEMAYFRYASDKDKRETEVFDTALSSLIGSSLFFAGILALAGPWLAREFHYPDFSHLFYWAAAILCLDSLAEIPMSRLRQEGKAATFARVRLSNILINLGFNLAFLFVFPRLLPLSEWPQWLLGPGPGVPSVAVVLISNALASLATLLMLLPFFHGFRFRFQAALWKEMMAYAWPLIIVGVSFIINEMLDRLLLPVLLSGSESERSSQLGIYSACYRLSMIMSFFTQAFRYGAEPFIFRIRDNEKAPQLFADVTRIFAIGGILCFLGVVLFLDIFQHFIGPAFRSGLAVVPILLLANLANGLYYNFSVWYKIQDKTRWGAIIAAGGAGITVLLNILLVPRMGYMGAAWATLACYAAMALACYLLGQRHYPIPYALPAILLYLALALALTWIAGQMGLAGWTRFLLHALLFAAYCLFLWKREAGLLRELFHPKPSKT